MSSNAKTRRLDCGTAAVDRISNLPRNVVDLILERLPIHDAAGTSILSKTWRDLWGLYPNLVFDEVFCSRVASGKRKQDKLLKVTRTISDILLVHRGPILKFHLVVPEDLPFHQSRHMDLWIRNISNHGVKKLELFNEPPTAYKMPSYLFSCSELTHLSLSNCILNPPLRFGGFCNLIEVELEEVSITGDMSFGTHLKVLKLRFCSGIEHLESQFKQSHNLINLVIVESGEIDYTWFECTRKVQNFCIMLEGVADPRRNYINLEKLVGNMPEIRALHFSGSFLKLSDPSAAVSKRLIPTLIKNLSHLFLLKVDFYDLVQILYVQFLMRSSPKLRFLYIQVKPKVEGADGMDSAAIREVMVASGVHCSQLPNFEDMLLDHLETVKILGMVGSSAELKFIKHLLASSPSLRRIKLLNTAVNDPKEESRIARVLLKFPRASTAAKIKWT